MSEQDYRETEAVEEMEETAAEPDLEAPEADAAEQRAEVVDTREHPPTAAPIEADEGDRAEQERVVDLGDDEYQ
ncbi:MAG TPA: hypothetical protein VF314_12950 [Actinomycetes bacterium]